MTFAMNLKGEMISRLVVRSPNPMRARGWTSCRRVLSEAPLMKQIIPFSTSIRRSKRDFLLHLARVHISRDAALCRVPLSCTLLLTLQIRAGT